MQPDRSAACPNCGHALAKTNRGWWWCSRCERRMRLKDSVGGSALLTSGAARQASFTPTDSAAENRYEVTVTRSRWGATADVGWYTDGVIGLQGPVFWRPTVRWVKRRADRHVARRLRMHARKAEVLRV